MAETLTELLSSAVGLALGRFLLGGKSQHHAMSSDRERLAGIARQERVALEQFYDRCAAKAFGLALSMFGSRSQSEALLAEVFWWVWQRTADVNAPTIMVEHWIYAIVYTRAVQQRHEIPSRREPQAGTEHGRPLP